MSIFYRQHSDRTSNLPLPLLGSDNIQVGSLLFESYVQLIQLFTRTTIHLSTTHSGESEFDTVLHFGSTQSESHEIELEPLVAFPDRLANRFFFKLKFFRSL